MAWKRLTDLGAINVLVFNNEGMLIPEEDFDFLGFTLTVGSDGTVEFAYSNSANAQGVNLVCVPSGDVSGMLARVTVVDALIEGAVMGGGEAGYMSPSFGAVSDSSYTKAVALVPDVVLQGDNENAVDISPNPWIFTDGPPPGSEHVFAAGEGMGMYLFPWVGV